ncbi:MAG TPA: hypothetical protein VLA92_03020 [Candidatus Saccharimonadales bacterium]|nr:hypothetical protein [Candidatus Saccharimonadales bacterium]
MRKHQQHRRLPLSGIFASKRVAVALCAAIAMVLGAMSVGASLGVVPSSSPADDLPAASQTGPSIDSNGQIINSSSSNSITRDFSAQNAVIPVLVAPPSKPPKSSLNSTLSSLNANISLGPISVNTTPQNTSLHLDTPVTDPLNVIVTNPVEAILNPPTETSSSDTPPATSEPSNPSQEEPQSITSNTSSDTDPQN